MRWLIAHSIAILRVSLGAVFFAFGLLKFFPGVSPAQDLVEHTTDILTLGLIPGPVALVAVAALECLIGLCLISAGAGCAVAIYLLSVQLIGILSPVVLLAARLFDGPHGAPTLEGQYVLKDVILVGAALVIAATVGGARLTRARWRRTQELQISSRAYLRPARRALYPPRPSTRRASMLNMKHGGHVQDAIEDKSLETPFAYLKPEVASDPASQSPATREGHRRPQGARRGDGRRRGARRPPIGGEGQLDDPGGLHLLGPVHRPRHDRQHRPHVGDQRRHEDPDRARRSRPTSRRS